MNEGLYWDDWVWFFQSPNENLKIGKELGIWWAGYVSNALYALPRPTLTLRLLALMAWVVSALAFVQVLRQTKWWHTESLLALVLLYCAIHICLIRFLNSVAFYNIYIASFWIGAALFATYRKGHWARWLCLPFFFFGFYLSSMLAFYGLGLSLLFFGEFHGVKGKSALPRGYRLGELVFNDRARATYLRALSGTIKDASYASLRLYWPLLVLPILFFLLRRLTREPSDFYRGYNAVEGLSTLQGLFKAWSVIKTILQETFSLAWSNVPLDFLAVVFVLVFLALLLARPLKGIPTLAQLILRGLAGLVLIFLGVFPYLVVGKPPMVGDFYESRHLMTSVPGIVIVVWTGISLLAKALGRGIFFRSARLLMLSGVLALFLTQSSILAMNLWADRFLQMAIAQYLKTNDHKFKDCRTVVISDGTLGYRVGNRKIWNYEYTGYLVQHYGSKLRLGIGASEYIDWPQRVALIRDAAYRKRYNVDGLDFLACHAVVVIENAKPAMRVGAVSRLVWRYLRGNDISTQIDSLFRFFLAFEKIEVTDRMSVINEAVEYLTLFYRQHGFYPPSENVGASDVDLQTASSVPVRGIGDLVGNRGSRTKKFLINTVPGFEKFQTQRGRTDSGLILDYSEKGRFQYTSDGIDFKLIYVDPVDLPYVKQVSPELLDYIRPGYGIWTRGALSW